MTLSTLMVPFDGLATFLDQPFIAAVAPAFVLATLLIGFLQWIPTGTRVVRIGLVAGAVALMGRYLWWRYTTTLPPIEEPLNWTVGVAFLGVETLALLSGALSLIFLTRVRDRSAEADAHADWAIGRKEVPLIDVFICTVNEEQRILERTIIGALHMDYPNFRTWVLDDGDRSWLRDLCAGLGCGYIARPDNVGAKAGNINHALDVVAALDQPPEFVSILDADFVPTTTFLSRAVTLFHDPSVGVVQTPQHFGNPDPIQTNLSLAGLWPDEQRYFFDIVMPGKDAWGVAFCCGTSSIVRFDALRRIGGVPTDSVTEDYLLTLRLKEAGFSTAYLNEPLTFGLAPEGLEEYARQRGRWCLGFMQIVRGRSGPFSPNRRIGFVDRISLLEALINWTFVYLYKFAGVIVPAVYLMFGIKAIQVSLIDMLAIFLPYYAIQSTAMSWISRGRVVPIMTDVAQLLTGPTALKAAAIGLFTWGVHRFEVTAKGGDRSTRFVEWPLLRVFLALLVFAISAVIYAFIVADSQVPLSEGALALAWSWYNIVALAMLCFACIEQPRRRRAGRFPIHGVASVYVDGRRSMLPMRDISTSGASFSGSAPAPIGTVVLMKIEGAPLCGQIVHATGDHFAVRFRDSLRARTTAVRLVYSAIRERAVERVAVGPIVRAVIQRLLR